MQGGSRPRVGYDMVVSLNPMTGLIGAFRAAALGLPVAWEQLGVAAVGAVLCFAGGCLYFRTVEDRFSDII
jgi:ABC-type polysaccharide/polyol phosphate export permease